jgi:hypothetical protein
MGGTAVRDKYGWTLTVHNKVKSTKPFNQFASEMSELSSQLSALDLKIKVAAKKHGTSVLMAQRIN